MSPKSKAASLRDDPRSLRLAPLRVRLYAAALLKLLKTLFVPFNKKGGDRLIYLFPPSYFCCSGTLFIFCHRDLRGDAPTARLYGWRFLCRLCARIGWFPILIRRDHITLMLRCQGLFLYLFGPKVHNDRSMAAQLLHVSRFASPPNFFAILRYFLRDTTLIRFQRLRRDWSLLQRPARRCGRRTLHPWKGWPPYPFYGPAPDCTYAGHDRCAV